MFENSVLSKHGGYEASACIIGAVSRLLLLWESSSFRFSQSMLIKAIEFEKESPLTKRIVSKHFF